MGPGDPSAFKLAPFSWPPTGRAFGPVGSLHHPGATSLSPESVFLNHSRGVAEAWDTHTAYEGQPAWV